MYGPAVVNSVMNGGNYIRGKRGMSLICEIMEQSQIKSFIGAKYTELFNKIEKLKNTMKDDTKKDPTNFVAAWNDCFTDLEKFEVDFHAFKVKGSANSGMFSYWNKFINNFAPVLRDLTRSFREAEWLLHISSVNRAIDLCFSFDRLVANVL